jgi:Uma2 family endonuclease
MAETPQHRKIMTDTIETLEYQFAADPMVYVSGNMFVYYVPGDRLRHVAPDVFLVRGIPKAIERRRYLVWEEGKGPDFIVEITSESTREEDIDDKFDIYQDWIKVAEYFLFDPYGEYLKPPLRGYRLVAGVYQPIEPVDGRLPSEVLGLHLERHGGQLRLYDPKTGKWLPTPTERAANAEAAQAEAEAAQAEAEAAQAEAEAGRANAESARRQEEAARLKAEAETEQLRRELEELRRQLAKSPPGPTS